jgi:hypothetical protein
MSFPGKYLMRIEADGRGVVQVERYVLNHLFLHVWFLFSSFIHLISVVAFGPGRDRGRLLILNNTTEQFGMSSESTFDPKRQCRAILQVNIKLRICLWSRV